MILFQLFLETKPMDRQVMKFGIHVWNDQSRNTDFAIMRYLRGLDVQRSL